jgi:LPS O-antigen subunit length determinant protein (WzzB/FepE family)
MIKKNLTRPKEISLLDFINQLYEGKFKILASVIVSLVIGLTLNFIHEKNFFFKLLISDNKISPILNNQKFLEENLTPSPNKLFFQIFKDELNKKEKIKYVIENNSYVKNKIQNFNNFQKKEFINKILNQFRISIRNNDVHHIFFDFSDLENGKKIFKESIELINKEAKIIFLKKINNLELNSNFIELSDDEIKNLLNYEKTKIQNKIIILNKHLELAKDLDIKTPVETLTKDNDILSNYYLLGYEHIKKKIDLLNNLSQSELIADSKIYEESIEWLNANNLNTTIRTKKLIKIVNNNKTNINIKYDINKLEISYPRSLRSNIILVFILGIIFGVIYIMVEQIIRITKK